MFAARSPRFSLPRSFRRAAVLAAVVLVAPLATAAAQSFQPPRVVPREFNFAVVDGDVGTGFLAQWHEGMSATTGFRFDAGLVDPDFGDLYLLAGATYLRDLNRATDQMPLDVLLTVGGEALIGDNFGIAIPVGVSLGRRFPLDGALAITPYVHPRVAVEYVSGDGDSETDLGIAFDIGADFEISERMSLRATFMFGSNDADAIGIGLAWRPGALGRR